MAAPRAREPAAGSLAAPPALRSACSESGASAPRVPKGQDAGRAAARAEGAGARRAPMPPGSGPGGGRGTGRAPIAFCPRTITAAEAPAADWQDGDESIALQTAQRLTDNPSSADTPFALSLH